MELGAEREYVGVSAIYQFIGNGVQLVSGSLFYIFAARIFDQSDMGVIALFIAIVGLFGIIFTLGLNSAITHFISSNLNSKVYSPGKTVFRILFIGGLIAGIGAIVLYVLAPYISMLFIKTPGYTVYVKLLSFVLFGNIVFSILNAAILGFERFKASAIISVVIWVIYYFGALVLASLRHSLIAIIYGWILGLILGITVSGFYVLVILARSYMRRTHRVVGSRTIFVYSLPLLLSSLLSYGAGYTDRFVVTYLMSTTYLGIYNFSILIMSGIGFISIPFNNITLPKFSEFYGNNNRENIRENVGASSLLLYYFYVPVALGIAALAPMVLYFVAGPGYVSGQYALMILMFIPALFISQNVLTQAISSIRRTSIFIYSTLASLIANIVISFSLIPFIGLIGAALGLSSTSGVTFVILNYLGRKENIVKFNMRGIGKIWLSAIVMFAIIFSMMQILLRMYGYNIIVLALLIFLGAIIFVVVTKYMKIFTSDQREYILEMFPESMHFLKRLISFLVLN
ncbi:oligosaccharide flippase family protein [Cuniculiplasma sp. SKW4]|uniref:oligosaccharide flippase family protein n=1 Tax=Cuniculiplasma sp. SKW4 TaxID=3400171 RepID=UPI003FCFB100